MPANRTAGRNVFVEFSTEPGVEKGGFCAATTCTRKDFLDMLNVSFRAQGGFDVKMYGGTVFITASSQRIRRGTYILSPRIPGQQIHVSNDRYYPRTLSLSNTARDASFVDQVRARDGRCVITRTVNHDAPYRVWTGFEAAHIFPLALNHIFQQHGLHSLITHNQPTGTPPINSPQNGILLRADIHRHWDNYSIAVNPSNGYRVYAFRPSCWDLHGLVLEPVCRSPTDSRAVVDALLMWHFEQAVLCNMRGAGEPIFEFDFPPGSDMVGTILNGPMAAERMEAELFTRMYGLS
jgi:HNH endonuclease